MKRIWIAVFLLAFAISLCICEINITNKAANEITAFVDTAITAQNPKEAVIESEKLIKSWDEKKAYLDIFLNHEAVDKISEQIRAVNSYAKSNSKALFESESVKLYEMAKSLIDSEKLMFENIL